MSRPSRYLVQVRGSGPWRLVAAVWEVERALFWFHELKAEHPCVRVVHDGRVLQSWMSAPHEEA